MPYKFNICPKPTLWLGYPGIFFPANDLFWTSRCGDLSLWTRLNRGSFIVPGLASRCLNSRSPEFEFSLPASPLYSLCPYGKIA